MLRCARRHRPRESRPRLTDTSHTPGRTSRTYPARRLRALFLPMSLSPSDGLAFRATDEGTDERPPKPMNAAPVVFRATPEKALASLAEEGWSRTIRPLQEAPKRF